MENTAYDAACGMDINPAAVAGKLELRDQATCFCSPGCKRPLEKDPEKYLSASAPSHKHEIPSAFENGLSGLSGQAILPIHQPAK